MVSTVPGKEGSGGGQEPFILMFVFYFMLCDQVFACMHVCAEPEEGAGFGSPGIGVTDSLSVGTETQTWDLLKATQCS